MSINYFLFVGIEREYYYYVAVYKRKPVIYELISAQKSCTDLVKVANSTSSLF